MMASVEVCSAEARRESRGRLSRIGRILSNTVRIVWAILAADYRSWPGSSGHSS